MMCFYTIKYDYVMSNSRLIPEIINAMKLNSVVVQEHFQAEKIWECQLLL